ncbi:hypothetical protein DENSPDRAFT_886478 [Dentipellis sp. KUC8613]|nr:hypothetical protein DENSPDRAFT_886478 [Dentipellis sp. KUC8613]
MHKLTHTLIGPTIYAHKPEEGKFRGVEGCDSSPFGLDRYVRYSRPPFSFLRLSSSPSACAVTHAPSLSPLCRRSRRSALALVAPPAASRLPTSSRAFPPILSTRRRSLSPSHSPCPPCRSPRALATTQRRPAPQPPSSRTARLSNGARRALQALSASPAPCPPPSPISAASLRPARLSNSTRRAFHARALPFRARTPPFRAAVLVPPSPTPPLPSLADAHSTPVRGNIAPVCWCFAPPCPCRPRPRGCCPLGGLACPSGIVGMRLQDNMRMGETEHTCAVAKRPARARWSALVLGYDRGHARHETAGANFAPRRALSKSAVPSSRLIPHSPSPVRLSARHALPLHPCTTAALSHPYRASVAPIAHAPSSRHCASFTPLSRSSHPLHPLTPSRPLRVPVVPLLCPCRALFAPSLRPPPALATLSSRPRRVFVAPPSRVRRAALFPSHFLRAVVTPLTPSSPHVLLRPLWAIVAPISRGPVVPLPRHAGLPGGTRGSHRAARLSRSSISRPSDATLRPTDAIPCPSCSSTPLLFRAPVSLPRPSGRRLVTRDPVWPSRAFTLPPRAPTAPFCTTVPPLPPVPSPRSPRSPRVPHWRCLACSLRPTPLCPAVTRPSGAVAPQRRLRPPSPLLYYQGPSLAAVYCPVVHFCTVVPRRRPHVAVTCRRVAPPSRTHASHPPAAISCHGEATSHAVWITSHPLGSITPRHTLSNPFATPSHCVPRHARRLDSCRATSCAIVPSRTPWRHRLAVLLRTVAPCCTL